MTRPKPDRGQRRRSPRRESSGPKPSRPGPVRRWSGHLPIWLLALTAAAFLFRLLNVLSSRANPFFHYLPVDCAAYDRWAQAIAAGDWIGRGVFYQDPLYPYFLGALYAILGRDLTAVLGVQCALGALNVPLLYGLGSRFWNPRVGMAAAILGALYAPFWFYDGLVLKTFLEVLLLNASLLALLAAGHAAGPAQANRWALAAGLLLGLGILARANYLLLLPLFLLWLLRWSPARARRLHSRAALCLAAGGLVAVLPVTLRNRVVGHDWVLTTSQGGQNLYIGNNQENDRGVYVAPSFVRPDPQHEQEDFGREAERRIGRTLGPSETSRFWLARAMAHIGEQPGRSAMLFLRKLGLLLHRHEIPDNEDFSFSQRYSPWLRWNPIRFGLVGPLAVAGLVLGWRRRHELALLYLIVGVYLVSIAAFFVLARYRLPSVSLLLLFAAAAVVEIGEWWRRGPRRLPAAGLGLLLGLALVHRPSAEERGPMSAAMYTNLGNAYSKEGRIAEALEAQRQAVSLAPEWAEARYNLGIALREAGDRKAAVEEFRKTISLYPDYAEAFAYLGNTLDELGDKDGAIEAHRRAMALQPDNVLHSHNLGRILLELGRLEEAEACFLQVVRANNPELSVEALRALAITRQRRGNSSGAAEALREYLRLRPDAPQRAELESALRSWEASGNSPPATEGPP